jgi:hypothetical protein
MKKKRIIRRSRGKSRTLYFNKDTQAAIVEFQQATNDEDKNEIYHEKIMPAFNKLAENLILIYGFARYETFAVLKNDCVSFCYETLHKFDESKGTKAFSYFNVVAKNWLILNSRRRKRQVDGHLSMSDLQYMNQDDKKAIAHFQIVPSPDDEMISKEYHGEIMQVLFKIKDKVERKNDIACIDAIIRVFEMIDQLDFLNKRAIFVYVREISGLNSKQLSSSMSTIRKYYREIKKDDHFFL